MTESEDSTAVTLPVLGNLTYREIHAFEVGVYAATRCGVKNTDYKNGKEDHYWKMGFLAGRIGIVATVYLFVSRLLRA